MHKSRYDHTGFFYLNLFIRGCGGDETSRHVGTTSGVIFKLLKKIFNIFPTLLLLYLIFSSYRITL
jgi:hypothetical protein